MTTPDFQSMMLPILQVLTDGQERGLDAIRDALAAKLVVSHADRNELLPSGKQTRFNNRANWACIYLTEAGLLHWVRRGVYRIAEPGRELLKAPPGRIDVAYLTNYQAFVAWRAKKQPKPDDGDDDDGDELDDPETRSYWAGGFTEKPRLAKFLTATTGRSDGSETTSRRLQSGRGSGSATYVSVTTSRSRAMAGSTISTCTSSER